MKNLKQLQLESKELEVFEAERLIGGFLADKGILASVEKFDNFFNIYISGYAKEDGRKKIPVAKLLEYFKSLGVSEDATIQKTKFGYTIEMLNDCQSEKLMEAVDENDEGQVCCICKKVFFGWGNDPWPISVKADDRCCDDCNSRFVIPERISRLVNRNKTEAIDKASVTHAASNVILDNKFIWLFNVLDKDGQDIEEGIEYLQDAIDILIKHNATFLVAFPYVDPKPEDSSVDLVFADNPGPVVIYNGEEATVSKDDIQRPSNEKKSKEESVKTESADSSIDELFATVNSDLKTILKSLVKADKTADSKESKEVSKAWLRVNNLIAKLRHERESKKESIEKEYYTENIAELQTSILYDKISNYFPEDSLPDTILDVFEELAEEYIEDNYSYMDILRMIENNYHEQLADLASEVYEAVLEYFNLEESYKLNEALGLDFAKKLRQASKEGGDE